MYYFNANEGNVFNIVMLDCDSAIAEAVAVWNIF